MSKKLELVSFKLCPFVQRAMIVLLKKGIDFDITYIDLHEPPQWFVEISPLGKVPILKVGDEVLFESSVIQEYVDEVTPPSLQPSNVLTKAKNRAWVIFGEEFYGLQYVMTVMADQEVFSEKSEVLKQRLAQLEQEHSGGSFFNGSDFNLIDASFAPFFMRNQLLQKFTNSDFLEGLPKLQKWSNNLLALDCVQDSVVSDFAELYKSHLINSDSYIGDLLKTADS